MIHKLTYEKPQSEVVRLLGPTVLQAGSGFTKENGDWDDGMMIFKPGSFEDLL